MGIADLIATFIMKEMSGGGEVELQRRELADRFGCVPSQINYVISTRFSPEHGFIVESRRGGGGYIRISRVTSDRRSLLMHAVNSIGSSIDIRSANAILSNLASAEVISEEVASAALAAVGETALKAAAPEVRPYIRAGILKQILVNTIR
ncbi:MAG: CtsR family transcriptional regulator [Ruminococcaceae bacterium]|nr:CtsR family transcriptional regulator [Oscillospiraceae bacterium]